MCSRETLRHYVPDLSIPIKELSAEEILRQFLYLDSGLGDERDQRKDVSIGLSEVNKKRRDDLKAFIMCALKKQEVREPALA